MPCVDDELWYLWTYEQRLRGISAGWTLEHQIEAYEELDLIAHMTRNAVIRRRCVAALTARPDLGLMVKFGIAAGGEAAQALFSSMRGSADTIQTPANLFIACTCDFGMIDETVHEAHHITPTPHAWPAWASNIDDLPTLKWL